jgi:hypothetical protein
VTDKWLLDSALQVRKSNFGEFRPLTTRSHGSLCADATMALTAATMPCTDGTLVGLKGSSREPSLCFNIDSVIEGVTSSGCGTCAEDDVACSVAIALRRSSIAG